MKDTNLKFTHWLKYNVIIFLKKLVTWFDLIFQLSFSTDTLEYWPWTSIIILLLEDLVTMSSNVSASFYIYINVFLISSKAFSKDWNPLTILFENPKYALHVSSHAPITWYLIHNEFTSSSAYIWWSTFV